MTAPTTPADQRALVIQHGATPIERIPRWRRVLRRTGRVARVSLLAILAVALAASFAGKVQQARLARAYPANGEMIDIGGYRLHVVRAGNGPSVVFENGPGGMALDWSLVQPAVAENATTLAYDRAGIGWSDPGPRPRDLATSVDELHRALQASGMTAPYVLVGHSYGGLVVRAFASTYPDEVAGLVLVDAAHEDQLEIYPEAYAAKAEQMARTMGRLRGVYRAIVGSGVPALFASRFPDPVAAKLPDDVAAARRAATLMDGSHAAATTDEMAALTDSLQQVRELRTSLGDLPVVVIRHGRAMGSEAGVPEGLEDDVEAAWQRMQDDLAELSTNSRLIVAHGSGHDIHVERPDIVIDAIEHVLEAAAQPH